MKLGLSVHPRFDRKLRKGGTVNVTYPDLRRGGVKTGKFKIVSKKNTRSIPGGPVEMTELLIEEFPPEQTEA